MEKKFVTLCIPPSVKTIAQEVASERPLIHPAWEKIYQRGRHFVLQTSDIEDVEELADWAACWLEEPAEPLSKDTKAGFQSLLVRAKRIVRFKALGNGHVMALGWIEKKRH